MVTRSKTPNQTPEVFLLAAKNVGVSPAYCLVVEDAVAGIESARRAGHEILRYWNKGKDSQRQCSYSDLFGNFDRRVIEALRKQFIKHCISRSKNLPQCN